MSRYLASLCLWLARDWFDARLDWAIVVEVPE